MGNPLHLDPLSEKRSEKVRFGPFQADLRTGILRKHNTRIRLAEQPFRILARLLRSPGELAAREELIELLWPDGTYVDFDRSLNAAVKKLRRALNDSPTDPTFIQTLPKKGYRFIAPVEVVSELEAKARQGQRGTPAQPVVSAVSLDAAVSTPERPRTGWGFRHLAVVAAGIVVGVGLIVLMWEAASNGGSSSAEAGAVRVEARALERFAERQWMTPALSPDGASVAFSWNGVEGSGDSTDMDIYVERLDGGGRVQVTRTPGRELQPTWSPDGLRIATWRQWPAPAPGVFVVSIHDGGATKVMEGGPGGVSWTPDGAWAVGPLDGGIAAVSIESGEQRQIVKRIEGAISFVRVAPDGTRVAFVHCPSRRSCDLFVQRMEGGEPRRVTFVKGLFGGMAWMPNSDEVVYSVDGTMYRIPIDGDRAPQRIDFTTAEPLTGRVSSPTIARSSVNGSTRMLFLHSPTRDADILETDISGRAGVEDIGRQRRVVDSEGLDWRAAYSPDGRSIVFESRQARNSHLWISDRDGSNRRQLTDSTYRLGNVCLPSWSPDGSQIAFRACTTSDNAFHVYTVSVDGGVPRRVTSGEDETSPVWSRNGLWIYYLSKQAGGTEVWRTPSDGRGPATPVSRMRAWSFAESADGQHLYFCGNAPPEKPYGELYRVSSVGGPAEKVVEMFCSSHLEFRDHGLYFLDRGVEEFRGSLVPLRRLDVRAMEVTEVARVKDPGGPRLFSLSPDGRSILTSELGPARFELMLVEDLR